jgi:acyl carrier protein
VVLPPEELTPDNFETVDAIATYVRSRQQEQRAKA